MASAPKLKYCPISKAQKSPAGGGTGTKTAFSPYPRISISNLESRISNFELKRLSDAEEESPAALVLVQPAVELESIIDTERYEFNFETQTDAGGFADVEVEVGDSGIDVADVQKSDAMQNAKIGNRISLLNRNKASPPIGLLVLLVPYSSVCRGPSIS